MPSPANKKSFGLIWKPNNESVASAKSLMKQLEERTFRFLTSSKLKPLNMAIRCRPNMERILVSGLNSKRRNNRSLHSGGSWSTSSGKIINFFVLSVAAAAASDALLTNGIFIKAILSISLHGMAFGCDGLPIGYFGRIFNVGYWNRIIQLIIIG